MTKRPTMGFIDLLLVGMFVAILIAEPAKGAGGGGHKSRGGKSHQKAAVVKSETSQHGITDRNLESRYVQFLFDPMEEEARKSLRVNIEEFLLGKHAPKADKKIADKKIEAKVGRGSGSSKLVKAIKGAEAQKSVADAESSGIVAGSSAIVVGSEGQKAVEAQAHNQLLVQLHLAQLKSMLPQRRHLLDKKSALGIRFLRAPREELLAAKARMRALIGDLMFLELEMREPFVLRIYHVEPEESLAYFEKILSAPIEGFLKSFAACRLGIPIMVYHLLGDRINPPMDSMRKEAIEKVREEFSLMWRRMVLGEVGSEKSVVTKETVPSMADRLHTVLQATDEGISTPSDNKLLNVTEQMRISGKHTAMALQLFHADDRLLTFVRRTRGARARLYEFLNIDTSKELLLHIEINKELQVFLAWTESDLLGRLKQEYILALRAKSEVDRLKPQMSVDILVQVLFLDKHFAGNESIQTEWSNFRQECLLNVEKMVDEDEDYAKDYGTMYKHMLYKLRNQQQPNKGDHWDLEELFSMERRVAQEWLRFERAGKKRPPFLADDPQGETAAQAAEWLNKEHAAMVERLQQEDAKFKEEIKAIEASSEVRVGAMFGSHVHTKQKENLLQLQSSEEAAGEGKDVIYHKCPKEKGINFRTDPKYSFYVDYLVAENPQDKEVLGLNSLLFIYVATILKLLDVCPAKHVDKLREVWAEEYKNLLQTERDSIKAENNPIKAKTYSMCKLHAFLLHRLVKAELGPGVDDEARNDWDTKLRENKISQTIVNLLAKYPNYGNDHDEHSCEQPEVAQKIVQMLVSEDMPMQWVHFFYLDWLINQYDAFRSVICNVADRLLAKERMKELMGAVFFDKLETKHPEILQIENMLPTSRNEYYVVYMGLHFDAELSHRNEIRIAVPLLVGLVRDIEAAAAESGGKAENKSLVESHVNWLLEQIFRDHEQLVSARSVCLLFRFSIWYGAYQSQLARNNSKGKQIATAAQGQPSNLVAYSKENELATCGKVEAQLKALKWQRNRLTAMHQQFLNYKVNTNNPGRKTALQRLVPGIWLDWKQWTYTGDEQLGGYFLQALFLGDQHLAQRLSTTFGVFFASWHRWVTTELLGKDEGSAPALKLFAQIWQSHEWQSQMLARHDALFCADVQSQLRTKEYWAKMQAGIKDLLLLRIPTMNKKGRKWQSEFSAEVTALFLGKDPQWNARWNHELWTEYNGWIQQRNRMELLALWQLEWQEQGHRRGFKQTMHDGFVQYPRAKINLIHMIGDDPDHLSEIEKTLGIKLTAQDFPEAIDYMKAEYETEPSTLERNIVKADTAATDHQELSALQIWTRSEQAEFNRMVVEYAASSTGITRNTKAMGLPKSEMIEHEEPKDLESTAIKMASNPPLSRNDDPKAMALDNTVSVGSLATRKDFEKRAQSFEAAESIDIIGEKQQPSQQPSEKLEQAAMTAIQEAQITKELQHLLEKNEKDNENGKNDEPKMEVEEAISRLKTTLNHWDNNAFLLLTGSYQLGLYTAGSDIDCLVVLPHDEVEADWRQLYRQHFLGEPQKGRGKKQKDGNFKKFYSSSRGMNPSASAFKPMSPIPSTLNPSALNPSALNPSASEFQPMPSTIPSALNPSAPGFSPAPHLNSPDVHYYVPAHSSTSTGNVPWHGHEMPPVYQPYASPSYPQYPQLLEPTVASPSSQQYQQYLQLHEPPLMGYQADPGYGLSHSPMNQGTSMWPSHHGEPRRFRRSPTVFATDDAADPSGPSEPGQDDKGRKEEEILCKLDDQPHCPNSSLYCALCREKEVKSLVRIAGQFPLIKVGFHGVNFKLRFVTFSAGIWKDMGNVVINKDEVIKEENDKGTAAKETGKEAAESSTASLQTVHAVDQLICAFADDINVFEDKTRKGMLLALSGYRANLRIIELLGTHPKDSFRLAMFTLKLWAKQHFVSGGQFGLLNGTTMTLLFVRIFLQHPEESVPALLAHFFDAYSRWTWPTPVELEPSAAIAQLCSGRNIGHRHLLDWSEAREEEDHKRQLNLGANPFLEGHQKLVWPVLTPGLPRQNAGFNINRWTARVIEREFEQSLQELQHFQEKIHGQQQQVVEEIKQHLAHWLGSAIKFESKYDHFVTIVCAMDKQRHRRGSDDFCDFVESRIRLQLLIAFGGIPQVDFMHANPEKVWHNRPCPQQMLQQQQQNLEEQNLLTEDDLCTIWLVGVQIVPTIQFGTIPATLSPEFIAQTLVGQGQQHFHDFVAPIRESFDRQQSRTGKKKEMAQKLMVKYYPREEVEKIIAGPK